MARKTVLVCDNCGKEVGEGKGAGMLVGRNFGGRTGYRVKESDLEAFLSDNPREGKAAA